MFGMPSAWKVPGFTELRELGAGASGRVVMARHDADGAIVAIKYLSDELLRDMAFVARFRHEARLLELLNSPQVARLYEYIETGQGAAIVMELVDGVSLRALLRSQGPTGPEAALVVLKGALTGLAAAHGAGVVHRDFKPENVIVSDDGTSKLVDFGIAVRAGDGGNASGTPPYMAPEQWTGASASPATDVYAATVVFFECLTGARPFRARNLAVLAHEHQSVPPPVEEVPPPLQELVERGLAKDPGDRPSSAEAFLAELEAVAAGAYGRDWENRGRRRLAALAGLLALQFPRAELVPEGDSSVAETFLGGGGDRDAEAELDTEISRSWMSRLGVKIAVGVGCVTLVGVVALVTVNSAGDTELRADTSAATPAPSGDEPTTLPGETGDPAEPADPVEEDPTPTPTDPTPTPTDTTVPPSVPATTLPTSTASESPEPTPTKRRPTKKPTKKPTAKPTATGEPSEDVTVGNPQTPDRPTRLPTPTPTTPRPTDTPTQTPTSSRPTTSATTASPTETSTDDETEVPRLTAGPTPVETVPAVALAAGLVTSGAVPVTLAIGRRAAGRHRRRR
ncbi:serine/threonine-protein kinase [Thermocatellispora tengchongensis]|uniref:non-specific serine/threonine protein kinase n=1 Tax=Thermocatellispora tengchongensis TaxID=1073253 RepID=A0A840PFC4_9ACTN|nr:serine/threonine-protein kinase [Thermocatellispora tengchongensis]MBB5136541.1 serine/threonine-protein kinase [Thermocatellispora tengchongensis]